jgi:hypothetical protein
MSDANWKKVALEALQKLEDALDALEAVMAENEDLKRQINRVKE